MWLPTPLYERAPQFWLLLGLLLISAGAYLGFGHTMAFIYIGFGFFCIIWSAVIIAMRNKFRRRYTAAEVTDITPPLDYTQPIHVSARMRAIMTDAAKQPSDAVRS